MWVILWVDYNYGGHMAGHTGKFTAIGVGKITEKGVYPDGNNLYLQVTAGGVKSWLFRYMMNGKAKAMGLGALRAVSLAEARKKAAECHSLIGSGIDPLTARKDEQQQAKLMEARSMTFEQCAVAYIEMHKSSWKNAKHIWQWENTMKRFVYPELGKFSVQDIDVALVMKALEPIWKTTTETATRVRGRIEKILDWASARGYREGENPARWRGKLENLLPAPSKISKVVHQPALPYVDMNEFMVELVKKEGLAALALELTILTATRTGETIKAQWSEFDLKNSIWIIPAIRIKTGKEHRVPLSEPALKILKRLNEAKTNDYVFSGAKGKPLSNMAMLVLLRRMDRDNITVHGFRSTFRDWAAEQTNFSREVAEMSLSHAVGDKVEAAYRRGDMLEKRRLLMEAWARYCYQPKGKGEVVNIGDKKSAL